MMGFEPTTLGTTIQCSNQLSYNHHLVLYLMSSLKDGAKIGVLFNTASV